MRRMTSGFVASALVVTALVAAADVAVADSHSEFSPVADSYVESHNPGSNYGTLTTIRTDGSPERNAYLRFDVQGQGTVSSAVLRVYAESNNTTGFEVRTVADSSWDESTITYANAPALGPVIATSGPVSADTYADVDVSAAISGDGPVTLALTSVSSTSTTYSSREGANPPTLFIPGPPSPSPFVVSRSGSTYDAVSASTGQAYSGSLKYVVEAAANELSQTGGGVVTFGAGTFDFGSDHFEFYDLVNVTFEGQGVDVTTLQNDTSEATDTEPFDFSNSVQITVRDMTVFAGGPYRSTSDALDFDGGDDVVVERVKVTGSRGRGIVFDGKETSGTGTADRNVVRDCSISNIPGDGIELLASSDNLIENCSITDVGGHGIQINKASSSAGQPNKPSNNNTVQNNTITNSGQDGININSGSDNRILNNTITNSSDDTSGRDGIRISSFNGVVCDDNTITGNVATDDQPVKTQRYGLYIQSAECHNTVIGAGNDFSGNLSGDIRDDGTNTQFPNDTQAPTAPANLVATSTEFNRVVLAWDASSDDTGVALYRVRRDGAAIGTVGGDTLTFTDDTVEPSTSYSYAVEAEDAAGNISPTSNALPVTTGAASSSFTVPAAADAYVNASSPGSNYGTSTQLRADASPVLRSYLRFDVSGVSGTPTTATLRLYARSNHNTGFEVYPVADTTWSETAITYGNAPTPGTTVVGASGPLSAGTWVEIDVSSVVTGNGTYTLALTPLTNTNLRLDSREATNQPELAIGQDTSGNTPPTADDVAAATDEDTAGSWTPVVSDPDPGTLSCSIANAPAHGAATVAGDCSSGGYTPDADYAGPDSFTYQVTDGSLTDTGTVTVTVNPVNDDPVAGAQSVAVLQDTATTVTLTGSDVDGDCPLTFAVADPPSQGSVGAVTNVQCSSGNATAEVLYTPVAGYTGPDGFTVTVADPASATSAPAQISVTVNPPQTSFTIAAAADAYVNASSPGSNYGTSTQLRADASPVVRSYLRFDVSGVSGTPTTATLRLYARSNHNTGFEVYPVADTTWSETAITYGNAPTPGTTVVGASGPLSAGTWVEIDVSSVVTGNGTYTLALTPLTNTNLRLDSREATNQPELVIETG